MASGFVKTRIFPVAFCLFNGFQCAGKLHAGITKDDVKLVGRKGFAD
jgi:hypothetical protein